MYRHNTDCTGVAKSSHKDEKTKNLEGTILALMIEVKANLNTPFHEFLHKTLRSDPLAEFVQSDPIKEFDGGFDFNMRKSDEGYKQIKDRKRVKVKFVLKLECSQLIEIISPDICLQNPIE